MRHLEIRPGLYRDSVQLMQISAALTAQPGVQRALVAMATPLNVELLPGMGLDPPDSASPNDLLIALVATDETSLTAALDQLARDLAGTPTSVAAGGPSAVVPRTTATAARTLDGSGIALVSTPGRYAFVEAMDALDAGLSVMVFSDNVPVEQEIALKRVAAERGLLVMGPDCGTAVIGGIGLGFANVVRPGPVGLVAASGTGAQQLMSLLAVPGGVGISHCLGVGGRDLSAAVGGVSTHAALDALDADPATELIVVLGKPPAPLVAEAVRAHAQRLTTPVIVAPLGAGRPDLTAVAGDVLSQLGRPVPTWPAFGGASSVDGPGVVCGLFSGGTLCVEAQAVAADTLGPVYSNVPLRPEWTISSLGTKDDAHTMIDLGADEYTLGRPHPMIDMGPRLALIAEAAQRASTRVLLLDVVLGHGAHPDPAAELAPAIASALSRSEPLTVVVSLVGTPDDPQGISRQAAALTGAGAWCYLSNAAAARHAVAVVA